jgi:hypothetical protein
MGLLVKLANGKSYYASASYNMIIIEKKQIADRENRRDIWKWVIHATISKWQTKEDHYHKHDPIGQITVDITVDELPKDLDLYKLIYDNFKETIDNYEDDDPLTSAYPHPNLDEHYE